MAKLTIREYEHLSAVSGGPLPVGQESAVVVQTPLDITGGSTQSAAFGIRTRFVRLHCDVNCGIEFGLNPTAIAVQDLAAGQTEYFGVVPGMKVATIAA